MDGERVLVLRQAELGPRLRLRRRLLVATACAHSALTLRVALVRPVVHTTDWLGLDEAGLLFLTLTSVLFLVVAFYAVYYLRQEARSAQTATQPGGLFNNTPEAVFVACLLAFLATMTLVVSSRHFGLLWVAIEATTLTSAPLIYFHRHHRSLEATWKYLLLCSVGIAVALLGNFFLAVAAKNGSGQPLALTFGVLTSPDVHLNPPWLKAAFLLILVGFGTKMGLAPMHTWLPDAHSEAPSLVSALLSGALLNCAFLGILRIQQVCAAAGIAAFGQDALIAFGLLSMAVAAVFILGQTDFKRMLAYSSVEHMGILILGLGLGGVGLFGSLLHAINHSLTKCLLFLVAGNILSVYTSKSTADVRGVLQTLPVSGALWLIGFLAITGSPPFGTFVSELLILKAALDGGHLWVAALYLLLLAIIFISMASLVLRMVQGRTSRPVLIRESWLSVAPAAVLAGLVLALGFYLPPFLSETLHRASVLFGGA
ncbi:MAG: NADH dehydrogenase FAD-containing subunit [Candidatus Firestonebacteria bacterium]|nr:NADH dehydrogenase FAD-containing subunit [Candidatus Firestonebacteria bacterium]